MGSQYYEKIVQLNTSDEFKRIIEKWQILSNNMKQYPMNASVLLPDMLWVAKSGVGVTNLLKLMSEYLAEQKNLMDFYGDVKFFEFLLNYCDPHEKFTELQRLMEEVNHAAGFRSEFRGVVHVNITEWLTHFEEKHFISFMEYLSANSDKWLVVLTVDTEDEKKLHNLESFLSMYLRLEKVTLGLPDTATLFEYVERNLRSYGLILEDDASRLLTDTLNKMRKHKYFDGFKSIKMLCQDIVYSVFSKDDMGSYSLNAEMLKAFSADSEYVKRTIGNIERVNKIGFLN